VFLLCIDDVLVYFSVLEITYENRNLTSVESFLSSCTTRDTMYDGVDFQEGAKSRATNQESGAVADSLAAVSTLARSYCSYSRYWLL